jgi:hypothetical protein
MTGTFKSSALIEAVRQIAAEQPDFNYKQHYGQWSHHRQENVAACIYFSDTEDVDDSTAMCLIGRGMEKLGMSPVPFWHDEELNQRPIASLQAFIEFESELDQRWLRDAQIEQDCGKTFGQAVEFADARRAKTLTTNTKTSM